MSRCGPGELMIGTILSQHYVPLPRQRLWREVAGIVGLLAILVPAVLYTANTAFPGLAALPPCIGAALLIAAGERGSTFSGRLLSLPPFVFFGLISYSLYLWHWPVRVFINHHRLRVCGPGTCTAPMTIAPNSRSSRSRSFWPRFRGALSRRRSADVRDCSPRAAWCWRAVLQPGWSGLVR